MSIPTSDPLNVASDLRASQGTRATGAGADDSMPTTDAATDRAADEITDEATGLPFEQWSARQVMAHHAKTFFWASRLLPGDVRDDIEVLYAFCRYVDDVADETDDGARHLERILRDFEAGSSATTHIAAFLELAQRRQIDLECPRELIRGAQTDLTQVRIADERALLRYSYRVASTVGLMFCAVAGVTDREPLAYAIDLGIAMQLTNIARDVCEDYAIDRVYLPATWIDPQRIARAVRDADPGARVAVLAQVTRLIQLAAQYYRSADRGIPFLPPLARWAVLTASRAYEGIGDRIVANPDRYWQGRVYTRKRYKLAWTVGAAAYIAAGRTSELPHDAHEANLHAALDGLPHAQH